MISDDEFEAGIRGRPFREFQRSFASQDFRVRAKRERDKRTFYTQGENQAA